MKRVHLGIQLISLLLQCEREAFFRCQLSDERCLTLPTPCCWPVPEQLCVQALDFCKLLFGISSLLREGSPSLTRALRLFHQKLLVTPVPSLLIFFVLLSQSLNLLRQ